jgi:ubiquinol-cytochrome c reductase cytochrome b subunit
MLRVVPDKLGGVLVMFSAIAVLFTVPWLDRGKVRSIKYRGLSYKIALGIFAFSFIYLGKIGSGPGTDQTETYIGRVLTVCYFGFFVFLWVYTFFGLERTKPVPERVSTHD